MGWERKIIRSEDAHTFFERDNRLGEEALYRPSAALRYRATGLDDVWKRAQRIVLAQSPDLKK